MTKKLFFQALTKFVVGLAIVMALLFIPAGTLSYWQAWLFIGILFIPMLIVGIVLMSHNPELLRKRLDAKEKEGEQKSVVAMSSSRLGRILYNCVVALEGTTIIEYGQ